MREIIPTYSFHMFKAGLQLATTHGPFLVRSTHPSSEGHCIPGQGVGASRIYPLDVDRNSIPARVIYIMRTLKQLKQKIYVRPYGGTQSADLDAVLRKNYISVY